MSLLGYYSLKILLNFQGNFALKNCYLLFLGVFAIDTTAMFFSIWARSSILISFRSLWGNSSNLSSSFEIGNKEDSRFKIHNNIFDNPNAAFFKEKFGKIFI